MGERAAWTEPDGRRVYPKGAREKEIKSYFGLVFQNFNLFPHYSVMKNITDAPIVIQKRPKDEVYQEARELLAKMGLSDKEDAYPCQLSGGQCQRVAIARALALNPKILFFDEPTRGIDVGAKFEIYKLMTDIVREGKTIIMVSSELPELIGMCDRIYVMCQGKITGCLNRDEFSQEAIMMRATGLLGTKREGKRDEK